MTPKQRLRRAQQRLAKIHHTISEVYLEIDYAIEPLDAEETGDLDAAVEVEREDRIERAVRGRRVGSPLADYNP
jgi:hypothetical protein